MFTRGNNIKNRQDDKTKKIFHIATLPLILLVGFTLLNMGQGMSYQRVAGDNGTWDLRDFDFENYYVRFEGFAPFVPNALLNPQEFAAREGDAVYYHTRGETHLTSRMRILVPGDGWYTFTRTSIDYSHRLYVNGEWIKSIGHPGASREYDVPNTGRIIFTARPVNGVIEIVQQSSNFVHRRGGFHHVWVMGAGSTLGDEARAEDFRASILMGGFFMLFLIMFLLYIILRGNFSTLYSALFCLIWFLRMGVTDGRVFTALMPWLGWQLKFRLEYISNPAAAMLTLVIITILFPGIMHKLFVRVIYIVSTGLIAVYLFADTVFMSNVILISHVVYVTAILYVFTRLVVKARNVNVGQGILVFGMILFSVSAVVDMFYFSFDNFFFVLPFQISGVAMLMFALCTAIAALIDTTREIEEVREAKQRAEIAEKSTIAKSEFLATMSHEIRTPMNAIMGIAQVQLRDKDLPSHYANAMERIYSSGNNLHGIINDILDMSKIEAGQMDLNPAEYDVQSFINDMVQLNIVHIGSKPIEFVLDIDESLPSRLYGDELRLRQILNNLLSNAIKYTEKGQVKLSVNHVITEENVSLSFAVADTGQGMKVEDKERLFTGYQRFNTETNRNTEGTGLGLNIARRLVEMMDGTIRVESEFGKGSIFTATVAQKIKEYIPIGKEAAQNLRNFTFSGNKQAAKLQITCEPMPYGSVLVVDDVDINILVAEALLRPYKLSVETVKSGFEAIEKVESGKSYDVIFMDHMMPVMDGIETTLKLREMGYTGLIVALTANALLGNDEMFARNGFDGFIPKPIDITVLNTTLNKFIRDRHPEEAKKHIL